MKIRSLTILPEQGQKYFVPPVANQSVLASASSIFPQVLLRLDVGVRLVAHAVRDEH